MIAFAISFLLDGSLAGYLEQSGTAGWMRSHKFVHQIFKAPGEYWFTVAVMIGVLFHPARWRASLLVFAGTAAVALTHVMKWGAGRFRPYRHLGQDMASLTPFDLHPFAGGLKGLFIGVPNISFPSGHTALAFATAAAMSILIPRGRRWFMILAAMVGVERVLENAHWLSDVVAAAALGMGGVWAVHRVLRKRLEGERRHGFALPVAGDPSLQRAGKRPHALEAG